MTVFKLQQPAKIDGLVNDFFNEFPAFTKRVGAGINSPMVNIIENKEAYQLELFAPGRKKEDFKISIEKDLLTISAEAKEIAKDENVLIVRNEFSYGSFKRSFTINEKISSDKIEAKYDNGILKVSLPKKEEVILTKEIQIQ